MAQEQIVNGQSGTESEEDVNIINVNEDGLWYIIQTYSGYENRVKVDLEQRIRSMDMMERIFNVVVPTEDEIEISDCQTLIEYQS